MGRRKKTVVTTEEIVNPTAENENENESPQSENLEGQSDNDYGAQNTAAPCSLADGVSDIATFLSGFIGDELTVRIYRYKSTGKVEYVGEGGTDLISERYIQEKWGGGRYRLMVYGPGQQPGRGASRTISISDLSDDDKERIRLKTYIPPIPVPQVNVPDTSLSIFQMQMENMRIELANSHAMTLKLIEQLGSRSGDSNSMTDMVQAIVSLKGLLQPPAVNPMSMISEILPLATKLIDLGAGRETSEHSWSDTIKSVLTEIPTILQGMTMIKKPLNVTSSQAQVIQQQALQPGNPQPLDVASPEVMQLKGYLDFLKSRAIAGQDYESWIETILNTLDQEQSTLVVKLLDRPYADIAKIDPELLDIRYRTWFEGFFQGLKDALTGNNTDAGNTSNEGNASDNGATDKESDKPIE
jgi:hypothetical protein